MRGRDFTKPFDRPAKLPNRQLLESKINTYVQRRGIPEKFETNEATLLDASHRRDRACVWSSAARLGRRDTATPHCTRRRRGERSDVERREGRAHLSPTQAHSNESSRRNATTAVVPSAQHSTAQHTHTHANVNVRVGSPNATDWFALTFEASLHCVSIECTVLCLKVNSVGSEDETTENLLVRSDKASNLLEYFALNKEKTKTKQMNNSPTHLLVIWHKSKENTRNQTKIRNNG
jgi:hypothetical protein